MPAITQYVEPETVIKRQRAKIARLTAELEAAHAVMRGYAVSSSVVAAELAKAKERERVLRAFVAAWDAWAELYGGVHSGDLASALLAAREAVGPCS